MKSLVERMLGEATAPTVVLDQIDLPRELTGQFEYIPAVPDAAEPEFSEPAQIRVFLVCYIDGEAPPTVSPTHDERYVVDDPKWEDRLRKEVAYFLKKELIGPYRIFNEEVVEKIVTQAKLVIPSA